MFPLETENGIRGQRTEDRRQRTEDGLRQKSEDGRQKTEDRRRPQAEDGGRKTEDGGQKTASGRSRRTEDRRQRTEDGLRQKSEDGGRTTEDRRRPQAEVGGRRTEDRRQKTEDGLRQKSEDGGRKLGAWSETLGLAQHAAKQTTNGLALGAKLCRHCGRKIPVALGSPQPVLSFLKLPIGVRQFADKMCGIASFCPRFRQIRPD